MTLLRLNLQAPLQLRALAELPLSLFPTLVLPLALTGSVLVLQRALRAQV